MIFLNSIEPIARITVESLINSIWQGMALTIVVFLILRTFRQINATTRYLIWWVTLIVVIGLPLFRYLPMSDVTSIIRPAISLIT